jgi:hypothetical protein
MKRFLNTKFVHLIMDASPSDVDFQVLKNEYDNFISFLFTEQKASTDKTEYHNSLVYIRVELASYSSILEKKVKPVF